MALTIIGLVLGVACFGYLVFKVVSFVKNRLVKDLDDKKLQITLLVLCAAQGLFTVMSSFGFAMWNHWTLSGADICRILFGSYMFGSGWNVLFTSFVLYYYKTSINEKIRKIIRIATFASIPFVVFGLIFMADGLTNYMTYPLPCGISFDQGFVNYAEANSSSFVLRFYGICVVGGAVLVYFICDHKMYKKFGKHGIIDTCFLVAFPAGLIGARLWYCFVLEPSTYLADPVAIFQVWDGGLAIQGGAMLGIIVGVAYMLIFRKYVDIRFAIDAIVPCILIAQAVGRWGNFFNCEVHGNEVLLSNWSWIPSFITKQMQYTSIAGGANVSTSEGYIYLPLFFIESCTNLIGYFAITYGFGKPLKKWLNPGTIAPLYLVWYGLTRFILEPFRYGNDASGSAFMYNQSYYTAIGMIAGGVVLCLIFQFAVPPVLKAIKDKRAKNV
ncbi:MAG: prolipoprotein diacylglyceryl transferase [Bacilli bacterium]|nr:prolipoprotein diacylglyceryl transferase [Bacilli bacterium]